MRYPYPVPFAPLSVYQRPFKPHRPYKWSKTQRLKRDIDASSKTARQRLRTQDDNARRRRKHQKVFVKKIKRCTWLLSMPGTHKVLKISWGQPGAVNSNEDSPADWIADAAGRSLFQCTCDICHHFWAVLEAERILSDD